MNKTTGILFCLNVLRKYSDLKHPLSIKEITDYMIKDYNYKVCRQSISKYIKTLNEEGYEISQIKKKYYFNSYPFEESEISLLCHSVIANTSIPTSYSKDLIEKLKSFQSINTINKNYSLYITNVDKRNNPDLFLNIDLLSEAIDENRTITFHYYRYNDNCELIDFNKKEYLVVPLSILAKNNRFYLLAINPLMEREEVRHYRIDRIKNLKITEKYKKTKPDFSAYEYAKNRMYMQTGDIFTFKLEINNPYIFDELIDNLGLDIIINKDNDKYVVTCKSPEQSIIYFACQYIKYVTIIEPQSTKEKIVALLKESLKNYK